jgi:hypothetical protein
VETLLESNWDFLEICAKTLFEDGHVTGQRQHQTETLQLQSCREFHGKCSGHKIHLIPSPDGQVRPDLVRSKMGRRESEREEP